MAQFFHPAARKMLVRTTALTLFFTFLAFIFAFLPAGAITDEQLAQALQTTVMIRATLKGGDIASGAGIVFGRDQGSVFIATARHVVARGDGGADKVDVLFRSRPDSWVPATMVERSDPGLDLAVIRVASSDPCEVHLERAADPRTVSRGSDIFPVGYPAGVPWSVPATAGRISRIDPAEIVIESPFLTAGFSGGPLLTNSGTIAGMLQSDAGPLGGVLPIGRLLGRLREWGYPVMLREPKPGVAGPLHAAAEKIDEAGVERELFACADVNARDDSGETPLHKAAANGHRAIASRLLERGADVNAVSNVRRRLDVKYESKEYTVEEPKQRTPLHVAIEAGRQELALLLIDSGADPNAKMSELRLNTQRQYVPVTWTPPLTLAIEHRLPAVVKALIDKRADVNATVDVLEPGETERRSVSWRTPLRSAIDSGWPDALEWLMHAGAKTNAYLLEAAINTIECDGRDEQAVSMVDLLLRSETAFEQHHLDRAIEDAIRNEFLGARTCFTPRLFELLIARGASVNASGGTFSPLAWAARLDSVPLATLLLANGADANLRSDDETPLHEAARSLSPGVISLLLKHGAQVDTRLVPTAEYSRTPLHLVQMKHLETRDAPGRRLEAARLLLSAGADPNQRIRDIFNPTLLRQAASNDDPAFVELLLGFGANPNMPDQDGSTPLHEAVYVGSAQLVQALLSRHANTEAKDAEGRTPLWHAVSKIRTNPSDQRRQRFLIVELLVRNGADVNSSRNGTHTLLDASVSEGDFETARFLLKHGARGAPITMERLAAASR